MVPSQVLNPLSHKGNSFNSFIFNYQEELFYIRNAVVVFPPSVGEKICIIVYSKEWFFLTAWKLLFDYKNYRKSLESFQWKSYSVGVGGQQEWK